MTASPSLHTQEMPGPHNDALPTPPQSLANVNDESPTQPDVRESLMDNLRAAKAAQSAIGIALAENGISDVTAQPAYRVASKAVDVADQAIYALHRVQRAASRPESYEE